MSENSTMRKMNADEIALARTISALWLRRRLIILGPLAATALAVMIGLIVPKVYRSEGFYQLGNPKRTVTEGGFMVGIPIPLYKKNSQQFFNPNRLQMVADQKSLSPALDDFMKSLQTHADISQWIRPVFAYSKEDTREFAQPAGGEVNSVIGLNLSYEDESPQAARQLVLFLGDYVRDCLLYVTLYDYVMDQFSTTLSKLNKNENDILEMEFALSQNKAKQIDIRSILTQYPESARMDDRQLVSVQDGGGRYLSPVTQLVGIASALADQRRQLVLLERQKEMLGIYMEYFSKCEGELKKAERRGEVLFSLLRSLKTEVFHSKDFNRDTVKEVANDLSIDLQAFDLVFFTNCRFISGPTLPGKHVRPQIGVIAIIVFLLATIFFLSLALLFTWWSEQKQPFVPRAQAGGRKK